MEVFHKVAGVDQAASARGDLDNFEDLISDRRLLSGCWSWIQMMKSSCKTKRKGPSESQGRGL